MELRNDGCVFITHNIASPLARGIRNNNPLNIVRSRSQWVGKISYSMSSDSVFEQFTSIDYGVRAALILLKNYITKNKLASVRSIITKWCPPSDKRNNTEIYIQHVENGFIRCHLNPYFFKPTALVLAHLFVYMAQIECSVTFYFSYVYRILREYKIV